MIEYDLAYALVDLDIPLHEDLKKQGILLGKQDPFLHCVVPVNSLEPFDEPVLTKI